MSRLTLFIPLILVLLVGIFFYNTMERINEGDYDPQAMPSALINKPFPEFSLTSVDEEPRLLTRQDLLGQVAIVNVWATWCPSCHIEHPYLNYLAKHLNVVIYGLNYKDDSKQARRWLKNKGNPYQFNIADQEGHLGLDIGVTGAPETYVIDHRGFIRLRYQGPINGSVWQEKFAPLIEQLNREKQEFERS